MIRRIATAVFVGGLLLATAAVVFLALQPPVLPPSVQAPIEIGSIAVAGDTTWRWSGSAECSPGTGASQLERRSGSGEWLGAPLPLVNVFGLSFNDGDHGIAVGTTARCSRGVAVTEDGGQTWHYRADNPVLLDAWWSDDRLWGVGLASGSPQLRAYELADGFRLVPLARVRPDAPCDFRDGPPSHVAFYDEQVGLLLCQQQATDGRLIARTTTAGAGFERLLDGRPGFGLDGAGPIVDLDVAGNSSAWLQFPADADCAAGQLRRSDSQGGVWERLPCAARRAPYDKILDVAFASKRVGLMLATKDGALVVVETTDGGSSWKDSGRSDASSAN